MTLFLLILIISGCGQKNNALPNNEDGAQNTRMVRNSNVTDPQPQSNTEVSQHLSNLAASVPNVNNATTVVLGNYAIVGLDVDADLERSKVGSIKYSVAESLKHDPYGANAVVIADPDAYARLQEVREDIQAGRPIRGILNELADITGRVMPEIPIDIVDENNQNSLDKQKRQMNEKDDQKLEQEQEKQSFNKK